MSAVAVAGTEITKAMFDAMSEVQQAVVNAEFKDRHDKALPVPTLEEIKRVHPAKFDPNYVPPVLSADAIKMPKPGEVAAPVGPAVPGSVPGPVAAPAIPLEATAPARAVPVEVLAASSARAKPAPAKPKRKSPWKS